MTEVLRSILNLIEEKPRARAEPRDALELTQAVERQRVALQTLAETTGVLGDLVDQLKSGGGRKRRRKQS